MDDDGSDDDDDDDLSTSFGSSLICSRGQIFFIELFRRRRRRQRCRWHWHRRHVGIGVVLSVILVRHRTEKKPEKTGPRYKNLTRNIFGFVAPDVSVVASFLSKKLVWVDFPKTSESLIISTNGFMATVFVSIVLSLNIQSFVTILKLV